MASKGGKAKFYRNVAWVFGILLVIGLIAGGYMFSVGNDGAKEKDKDSNSDSTPSVCDSTTTPAVVFNAYDDENKGTAISDFMSYRKKGSVAWSNTTTGSSIDMSFGVTYEVVMGINPADSLDNAYGQFFTYTVPCQENPTVDKAMFNDEVETSLSATFYNADGDASAETFTAGQAQEISLKFQAGSDEVFGNPFLGEEFPNVLCLNLNKTAWDAPDYIKLDGKDLPKVGAPIRHSTASTETAYCYKAPVITEDEVRIKIKLNADDSNAPTVDDTAYIYAANWYIDDNAKLLYGVEDEDGNAIGTDTYDSVTLDFTA